MRQIGPIVLTDNLYELMINEEVVGAAVEYLDYGNKPLASTELEKTLDSIREESKKHPELDEYVIALYRIATNDTQRASYEIDASEDYRQAIEHPIRRLGNERFLELLRIHLPDHPALLTMQEEETRPQIDSPDR